ncbi:MULTISPECIES: hypothetical protein [unclassified Companilactobacillus]|jgi:hypothetical protein|uniref:hypothetical protein n=1 Tax=unclassified Companilactobacillus TaxID=2767904 RepID=UPI002FF2A0D8
MIKNKQNQKRGGMMMLNCILMLSVAILIIGYSTNLIGEQIAQYRQLDEMYLKQINENIHKRYKL